MIGNGCAIGGAELGNSLQSNRFVWLQFKADFLWEQNIPPTPYPIESSFLDALLSKGGVISIADIIRGLMSWMDVVDDPQPSCQIIQQILRQHYPPTPETHAGCEFQDQHRAGFRLRIGSIPATAPVVVWHRGPWVVAIGRSSKSEPGRLTIGAPRPITTITAKSILSHSRMLDKGMPSDNYRSVLATIGTLCTSGRRAIEELQISSWPCGYDEIVRRDYRHGNAPINQLPTADRWLAPNQVVALLAIANGYV